MQCITTDRYSVSSVPEWLITSVCQISFTHHDSNKISSSRYSSMTRHTQVPQGICPWLELSFRVIGLLFRVVVWVTMRIYGYTDCKQESWTLVGTTLSEMPTSIALPTSHHFHPSLSPVVSHSLGILYKWMKTQMLTKSPSNLLQRTGGDNRGGRTQPKWGTFMMTCLRRILGNMRLIWRKIGLSGDWCLHSTTHS